MNNFFGKGRQNFAAKAMSWTADTIKASLLTLTTATAGVAIIASSTNASPIVVTTTAAHNINPGDIFTIGGHATNTAANGTWQAGTVTSTTVQLLTRLDGNNSTGNGVGGATGWVVNLSGLSTTISDLGGNGGANGNGTDVSLSGTTNSLGILNASSVTFTGLTATKSYAVALYDSTASNDLIAWEDGTYQIYVVTQAAAAATSIAIARLPVAIANGTTIVFSDGSSATLTAQANIGDTSLAVSSLAAIVHRQATADVVTFNTGASSTSGLPFTPAGGSSFTITWDTGANKIGVL